MRLSRLIEGVQVTKLFQTVYGAMVQTHDVEINNLHYDSRRVGHADVFVAIRGSNYDGHAYLHDVLRRKVKVVVVEDDQAISDPLCMHEGVIKIVVPNARKALSRMSANYFGNPSREIRVVGVTGTNGKTTTTYLLASIVKAAGEKAGVIGTIEYHIGDEVIEATHTTPESYELHALLRRMVDAGCSHAVMEVSSHALEQSRVDDVRFSSAVFLNLTQDHLDYHGSMEAYFAAKRRLFMILEKNSVAVTNADSEYGSLMVQGTKASVITFAVHSPADIVGDDIRATLHGTSLTIRHGEHRLPISSPLVGRFNVSNILAAYGCAYAEEFDVATIKKGIESLSGVRGRFETVRAPDPLGWIAVIDYSHTPDALENVLTAIREIKPSDGSVITVFGCGGDRDRGKRPLMGAIAQRLSDTVIVTSDNPRTEDPEKIIDDIVNGMETSPNVLRETDRRCAIERGLSLAERNDVVLIAGKGHETYQILGRDKIHFSDREIVEEWIRNHLSSVHKNTRRT